MKYKPLIIHTMAKKDTTAAAQTAAPQTESAPQTERKMTLAAKVLAAKNEVGKIAKDGTGIVGSETKGNKKEIKYATLSTILEKVTPVLFKYNIDYVIAPIWSDLAVQLLAQGFRLFGIHFVDTESGETSEPIIYPFRLASNPEPIKADGSTITYVTRYLLGIALGLQTEVDPDQQQQRNQQSNQQTQKQAAPQQAAAAQGKQRTFKECANGFYATYNKGDLEGAKKTLAFVDKYWGDAEKFPDYQPEIQMMHTVDLTTWKPLTQAAPQQVAAPEPEAPAPTE